MLDLFVSSTQSASDITPAGWDPSEISTLSSGHIDKLFQFNERLKQVEHRLRSEELRLYQLLLSLNNDTTSSASGFDITCQLYFHIRNDDPESQPGRDNTLIVLTGHGDPDEDNGDDWGVGDGRSHFIHEFDAHPALTRLSACYTLYRLIDNRYLGLSDMFRIGPIEFDFTLDIFYPPV